MFLNYDSISSQDYLERGGAIGALSVEQDKYQTFESGLGILFDWLYEGQSGSIINPSAYVQYKYDILSDRVETVSTFIEGPETAFVSKGYQFSQNIK